jgi:hypothetical protein
LGKQLKREPGWNIMVCSEEKRTCPKCKGEMECGIILDHSYTALKSQQWKKGLPIDEDIFRDLYDVRTFRCGSCGYLESYALNKTPMVEEESEEGPPIL